MASAAPLLPKSAFQTAIDAFKSKSGLSPRDIQNVEITTLHSLQSAISTIQNQQQASRKMMYLKRLKPFLDAMDQYGRVIEVFLNASDILAYVWGPMKFLLLTLSNFSEAFNALLDGYYEIGKSLPLLLEYQELLQDNLILRDALVAVFEDILEFHAEAVRYFRQKTWKTVFHATWNHINKKILQLVKSLKQQKGFFESAVSYSQYREGIDFRAEVQREFQQLGQDLEDTRADFNRPRQEEMSRQRFYVLQWLGALDVDSRHQDALKKRHAGTGEWLRTNARFESWYRLNHCSESLLWLSGKPGSGKTILSSFIIEELKKFTTATVVFYYCKQNDPPRSGFLSVAKALLAQLLAHHDELLLYLHEKASTSGQVSLSNADDAKKLLETALKSYKNTYIVIDGLDEYSREDRKEIATWFQETVNTVPTQELGALRCIFLCQEDGYAKKDLSMLSHIKLTDEESRDDIRSYSRLWQQKIEDKFGLFSTLDITNTITARSQGMFLYARLVLENLFEQTTRRDLERELDLDVLPTGFEQAYSRIAERLLNDKEVPVGRRTNVRRLLSWLACAKRPLKWHEIQAAMSVDTELCTFDRDGRFVEDCKDLCASLVDICSDGSVTLVHATAREFLIQQKHVDIARANIDLGQLCLVYLTLGDFQLDSSDRSIRQSILRGVHAFLDYAICFWGIHLESGLCKMNDEHETPPTELGLLIETLDTFLEKYWIPGETSRSVSISGTLRQNLRLLNQSHMLEQALCSVSASRSAIKPLGKNSPCDTMLGVYAVLKRSRNVLESISSSGSLSVGNFDTLERFYGKKWFKCSRLNCQFFHRGFETLELRQRHTERHDRSFVCSMEGCPQSSIGCVTLQDLKKHMFDTHGISEAKERIHDGYDEFPEDTPQPLPVSTSGQVASSNQSQRTNDEPQPTRGPKKPKAPSSYQCTSCPRKFTRLHNFATHTRTHTGERPYPCRECNARFARRQELSRHTKIHTGEKRFFCEGRLKDNSAWGCSRSFARSDALAAHYTSTAGKLCIKPMLEEKAREQEDSNSTVPVALLHLPGPEQT